MQSMKGGEQARPSGDSYPKPTDTSFLEADLGREEGHSEISPLSCLLPLVSLFSCYFTGWH